jgi:AAA domain
VSESTCSECGGPVLVVVDGRILLCRGCGNEPGACKCDPVPRPVADPVGAVLGLGDFPGITRGVVSEVKDGEVSNTSNRDLTGRGGSLTSESNTSNTSNRDMEDEPGDGHFIAAARDGAWLTAQDFPALAWAVDGLIPEGLALLVAAPKAGKSWLALTLLLAVASPDGIALGAIKTGPARRVFYLALEDSDRRIQERCRALLGEGEPIPDLFCYQTRAEPGAVLATIDAWMGRYPDTALIVIDTLGRVMPPALQGEGAYQRDYRVGAALKARADKHPGLSIIVAHHDRKAAADDFVDSVSGTHGLAGAADTVMLLARRRQAADAALKVTGRDVPEDEYALTILDGTTWQANGGSLAAAADKARDRKAAQALSPVMADVLAAVREHPEGVRAGDLAGRFGKAVYTYLARLVAAGRVDKLERGLYIPLLEVSEVSDSQVRGPEVSNSAGSGVLEVSETWSEGTLGAEANADEEDDR